MYFFFLFCLYLLIIVMIYVGICFVFLEKLLLFNEIVGVCILYYLLEIIINYYLINFKR